MAVITHPHSPAWRNASQAVGDLPAWLQGLRASGASFQFICGTLAQHGVMVSQETIRGWCNRLEIEAPSDPEQLREED